MTETACITGITGQTGSYLCDLLLSKGYKVYGLKRRSSSINTDRIDHVYIDPHIDSSKLEMVYGDLSDYSSLASWIADIKPDLFFNMGAQSHVRVSFDIPEYTMDVTGTGVLRVLEAIRKNSPKTKFLTASSSEMFGSQPPPQNEQTPFYPRSPYGVAKVAGYFATVNYREAYGLHACNAISFNHESPRRGETFVTRKITMAATRIKLGLQDKLYLGILDLEYSKYIEVDPKYLRPSEVDALCGDSTKIRTQLNWEPSYSFLDLVQEMVDSDMELARKEKTIKDHH